MGRRKLAVSRAARHVRGVAAAPALEALVVTQGIAEVADVGKVTGGDEEGESGSENEILRGGARWIDVKQEGCHL